MTAKDITIDRVKNSAKLRSAQQLAASLSLDSLATEDGKSRESVSTFPANPNLRVTISHLSVKEFSDILNRAIDSGDYDRNPTIRRRLIAIAAKTSVSKADISFLESIAPNDPRIKEAILVADKDGMQRSSTPMDITETVTDLSVKRDIEVQGGTCNIDMVAVEGAEIIAVGDKISVFVAEETLFVGKIMKIEHPDEHNMQLECVDAMWYLKNNIGWIQPKRMKLSDAFVQICQSLGLPYQCKVDTKFLCPARVEAGATGMSIIKAMIEETLYAIGKQYFVRMTPTLIELRDIEGEYDKDGNLHQEATKFDIVEAITGFKTTESVLDNVANDVRFFTGSTNSLALHEVQDMPSIARYGMIRYHEVAQNAIVTEQTLDNLLRVLKYPTRDLSVDIVGLINLLPGDIVTIAGSVYVADNIDYNYSSSGYNMSINMAQWQKPDGVSWDFASKLRQNWESEQKILDTPTVAVDSGIGDLKSAAKLITRSQNFIADATSILNNGQLDEVSKETLRNAITEHQKNVSALKKAMNSEKKAGVEAAMRRVNNDEFYSVYKKVGGKK